MKILKRPPLSFLCLLYVLFTICSSCASTKNTVATSGGKLVQPTTLSAGEGESEILVTWSGGADKNKTSYPLAVVMDWYESDDAMKAGNGEKGSLAAQIDRGRSGKIIVKNGVAVLHVAGSMYNAKNNTWNAVESAKANNFPASKLVPITLENNTITGTTIVTHPQNNLISIEVLDAGLEWYPVNVKKAPLPGREDSPPRAQGAASDQQAQTGGQAAAETRYNVAIENQPAGPFGIGELGQMAQKGRLTKESLVWREGMSQWEIAGNVPELAPLFQTAPAPPQPVQQTQPRYSAAFNGISSGPYTLEELKPFAEKGQLTRETLIWKEGSSQWVAASSVPEVAALIPQTAQDQPPAAGLQPDAFVAGKFFILVDGQPSGPLSIDALKQQIEKRQLARSSLVWREGLQQWVAAESLPELTNIFPVIPPPPPPQTARSPMRYYIAANGYPDGPYTMDELRQKLQSGQIGQRTLVWKEDMPQWAAMSAIPEFSSLFTAAAPAPEVAPSSAAPQTAQQGSPQQLAQAMYHVAVKGLSTGPFTIEELKQKAQSGQLTRTTQVWKSGMTQWAPAGAIAELQSLF